MGGGISYVTLLMTMLAVISTSYCQGAQNMVTVRKMKITSSPDNGTPGMKHDVYFVKFEAELRNTSDHAILVATEGIISTIAESLLPSGEWKPMFVSSSRYDKEDQPSCMKVEPGKTLTTPNLSNMIVLGRDRPANETVTVRFHFYSVCKVGSARHSTEFVTEGIQVKP